MSAAKKLTRHFEREIEKPKEELSLLQVKIPIALRERVAHQIAIDKEHKIKITWKRLIEAALVEYLKERGVK